MTITYDNHRPCGCVIQRTVLSTCKTHEANAPEELRAQLHKMTHATMDEVIAEQVDIKTATLRAENETLKAKLGKLISAIGPWSTTELAIKDVERLKSSNERLVTLAKMALENLEDDIECKAMRHSCGRLIAELRVALLTDTLMNPNAQ